MKIKEVSVENRTKEMIEGLVTLWESSVIETHTFLSDDDRAKLKPYVYEAIMTIEILNIVMDEDYRTLAFMGIENKKIEMLFVGAGHRGKGIGKELVAKALVIYSCISVDVNEQNEDALNFYLYMGFKIDGRTETDEMGNPYPILQLIYEP